MQGLWKSQVLKKHLIFVQDPIFNIPVPEGLPKIARRFNAGNRFVSAQVPKGRLNRGTQPSLRDLVHRRFDPAVNCRAILNGSFGTEPPLATHTKIEMRSYRNWKDQASEKIPLFAAI